MKLFSKVLPLILSTLITSQSVFADCTPAFRESIDRRITDYVHYDTVTAENIFTGSVRLMFAASAGYLVSQFGLAAIFFIPQAGPIVIAIGGGTLGGVMATEKVKEVKIENDIFLTSMINMAENNTSMDAEFIRQSVTDETIRKLTEEDPRFRLGTAFEILDPYRLIHKKYFSKLDEESTIEKMKKEIRELDESEALCNGEIRNFGRLIPRSSKLARPKDVVRYLKTKIH